MKLKEGKEFTAINNYGELLTEITKTLILTVLGVIFFPIWFCVKLIYVFLFPLVWFSRRINADRKKVDVEWEKEK